MFWLTAHIWLELLIAAAFGGLIGWALRERRGGLAAASDAVDASTGASPRETRRLAELEDQLKSEREEADKLKRRLNDASESRAKADAEDEASMAWRNRYLESRVRFLEGKIADLEDAAARPPEDKDDQATRLRWRNTYLEGRVRYLEEELVRGGVLPVAQPAAPKAATAAAPTSSAGSGAVPPPRLDGPRNGLADDLRKIGGVGPKIEQKLNALGVYHYDQIAAWRPEEIDWINREISFKGRIERERWVEQARALASRPAPSAAAAAT